MGFRAGLFALVLAPEAYLPLRRLAASFHASAEGLAAAQRAFEVIDAPARPRSAAVAVPNLGSAAIALEGVTVTYPGRSKPALADVSLRLQPREVLGLTGPSGCGKSTLLAVLLGLLSPDEGSARVGEIEIGELDPASWHAQIAWVPQRPHVFRGSLAENVALGRPDAGPEQVRAALERSGLLGAIGELPDGLDTPVGEGGRGLSAGERRRLALARAIVRDAPLLLLDEPTAGLDLATERHVLEGLSDAVRDRTVLIVTHRPAPLALCDRVVSVEREAVAA